MEGIGDGGGIGFSSGGGGSMVCQIEILVPALRGPEAVMEVLLGALQVEVLGLAGAVAGQDLDVVVVVLGFVE